MAWEYWPTALKYREGHAFSVLRSRIARYMAGQDSLTPTACQLASDLVHWQSISLRVQEAQPARARRILDPGPDLVPAGTDPKDPKFMELMINASRFAFPKDFPSEVQTMVKQEMDSLLVVHRFRRVRCGAA